MNQDKYYQHNVVKSHFKYLACSASVVAFLIIATHLTNSIHAQTTPSYKPQSIRAGLIIFPPLAEKINNQSCVGESVERLKQVFIKTGYDLSIKCSSAERIYRDFEENEIELTINFKNNNRIGNKGIYTTKPFNQLHVMLYENKNVENTLVSIMSAMNQERVSKQLPVSNITFQTYPNGHQAMMAFLRGNTRYLVSFKRPFEEFVNAQTNTEKFAINYTETHINDIPSFIVMNKKTENGEKLVTLLQKVL